MVDGFPSRNISSVKSIHAMMLSRIIYADITWLAVEKIVKTLLFTLVLVVNTATEGYWGLSTTDLSITRYVKLRVVHAPDMPRTFSPPPTSKGTDSKRSRHASRQVRRARAVMDVGIASQRWRGKRSRHYRHMRNPKFYVSGKRCMGKG